jgi:hypothetical protein
MALPGGKHTEDKVRNMFAEPRALLQRLRNTLDGWQLEQQQRDQYVVNHGDTLQSVADDIFGAPELSWLLAELNAAKTNQWIEGDALIVELEFGMSLDLPTWSDLRAFYQDENKQRRADRFCLISRMSENAAPHTVQRLAIGSAAS